MDRVRLILPLPDGRYLLELFDNPAYPDSLGKFRFPGGGVEPGETLEQAAVREAREEFGAAIPEAALRYAGRDPRPGSDNEYYFAVDDHGVPPGRYEDAAAPGAKITLFPGIPAGDGYIGPDLSTLT